MTPHLRPTLSPDAAASIRLAVAVTGADVEHCFRCEWDAARQQVTSAVLTFRGNVDAARFLPGQYRAGELFLHSHPSGHVVPSDADLDTAVTAAAYGVGCAITDNTATALYVITTPEDVAPRTTDTPEARAYRARVRRRSGRLFGWTVDLTLYPQP